MALPKRWEPYTAIGQQIEGTRFVSFKVPLNEHLNQKVSEELRFSPDQLVKIVADRGQSLGLVIDLTNTTRYYDKQELIKCGIKYEKIFTEGKRVPSKPVVDQFFTAIDQFLAEDQGQDVLIGVHCTHGVNRTGYLVCRYMVEKMSIPPEDAIKAFIDARGHPIEREIYIKDLKLRENGGSGLPEEESLGGEWKDRSYKTINRGYHGDWSWRDDQRFPRGGYHSHFSHFRESPYARNKFPPRRPFQRRDFSWSRYGPPNHRQLHDGYRNYDFQSFDRQIGYQNFNTQNGSNYPEFNAGYYEFDEHNSYGYKSFDGQFDQGNSSNSQRRGEHCQDGTISFRGNRQKANRRGRNDWRRY